MGRIFPTASEANAEVNADPLADALLLVSIAFWVFDQQFLNLLHCLPCRGVHHSTHAVLCALHTAPAEPCFSLQSFLGPSHQQTIETFTKKGKQLLMG